MWLGAVSFNKGIKGYPEAAQDEEKIRRSIRDIVLTNPGERVMRPEYGAGLKRYIFEPVNEVKGTLRRVIWEQLTTYEPRIEVTEIEINDNESRIEVNIEYRVKKDEKLQMTKIGVDKNVNFS